MSGERRQPPILRRFPQEPAHYQEMSEGGVCCVANKSQLATRSSLTLFSVPPQSAMLREGLSWLSFKWPLGRRKGIKSCARGRTGPGGERRAAVVPTMVFLSRYVVGGVACNVQGNEHLALLPIPFQLPVVGAQEKEGREAGVIAHRRARPQRRPQQQRQEESPRGPATALHAAAAAAARPERRSLIQFGRRRDGGATRREGEKAADGSRAGSGAEPLRQVPGETAARKVSLGRGRAGPGLRAPRARRPPPPCAAAAAASARRPSARPGKAPAPLHTFLKPRAPSPPRRRHTCPGRSPRPRAPPRARPPGPRPLRLARPHLGRRGAHASRGPGPAAQFPPGRAAEGREPEEGVGLGGCCRGPRGPPTYSRGRRNLGEREPPAQLSGRAQEDHPLWPSDFPLFPERRRGGKERGGGAGASAGFFVCAARAPRPSGSPASEPGRPALVLGIRPRPRTARGPCAPLPSRPRVPPAAPRPAPRRSDRASSVAGF